MRIAVLTDNDFTKVNGVTTTLKAVLAHAPQDVRPHIYTFADEKTEQPGYTALAARGVPIPFHTEMRMYVPAFGELRQRLEADGVGAIHLTTPGPAGLAGRRLADLLGLPLVGSYHTELGEYTARLSGSPRLGRLMQQYMRWLYDGCTQVLVPSEATRAHLESCGWRRERLGVWSRGVDATQFTPARRSAGLRTAWRVSDARPAILYAGRLSREKGLPLLEHVSRLLDDYRMPHRFVICGDGPMQIELRTVLPNAVFTGKVSHRMMSDIMASSDLLLFPSETDTAGNVVLEAQASGLPVLVSDRGGPQENMLDGKTGFVCRAGSERDFCCRTAELLVDSRKRAAMSAAARQYALSRDWTAAMKPLFDAYRDALRSTVTQPAAATIQHEAHV